MRGYTHGYQITPSDSQPVVKPCQAVWVGGGGSLAVILSGDTLVTVFNAVPAGALLEIMPKFVRGSGTTCTLLIGLSE
jgi:hypothetical protein